MRQTDGGSNMALRDRRTGEVTRHYETDKGSNTTSWDRQPYSEVPGHLRDRQAKYRRSRRSRTLYSIYIVCGEDVHFHFHFVPVNLTSSWLVVWSLIKYGETRPGHQLDVWGISTSFSSLVRHTAGWKLLLVSLSRSCLFVMVFFCDFYGLFFFFRSY